MTKCQKEEKWFCKTQKHELQLLPAAGGFHKNELELFWRIGPDALLHLPMPPGYPPFLHCHLIFYFFSIFCIQHISVSFAGNFHAQPAVHHVQFLPADRTLRFHHFFVQSILSLSSAITHSSGASRPYQHATSHSYPSTGQSLAFRLFRPHPHHISNIFSSQSNLSLSSAITLSSGTRRPSSYP